MQETVVKEGTKRALYLFFPFWTSKVIGEVRNLEVSRWTLMALSAVVQDAKSLNRCKRQGTS